MNTSSLFNPALNFKKGLSYNGRVWWNSLSLKLVSAAIMFLKEKKKTLNLDICIFTQGLWFMVLDNTTSPDYKLCVKTMYQARDKEIVEVLWCSTF